MPFIPALILKLFLYLVLSFFFSEMAADNFLLPEDLFQCSICLDVFKDPVSTPCGHNFCKNCITEHLNLDVPLQCPICRRMFYPKPELQTNTLIKDMIDALRQTAQNRPVEVHCAVCSKTKQKAQLFNTACLFLVFILIVYCISLRETSAGGKLEKADKNLQEQIQEIGQKIEELRLSVQLCDEEEHVTKQKETQMQFIDELNMKELSEVEQFSNDHLKHKLEEVMETPNQLARVQQHAIEVTFDPDTAHSGLILSADRKQVRCCDSKRKLPENPKRFTESVFVLGKQGFSSGRFYFEVQVKGKTKWSIGVAKESVSRKGDIKLRPQNGFWTLWMKSRGEYRALAGPPVSVPLRSAFEKVGVFVDYEAGLVSFHDVNNAATIYSFTGCHFTERLFPFFDPSINNDGQNYAPLII